MTDHHQRRLAIIAASPDQPMPGAKRRMDQFDSLPKPVRQAIANSDHYTAAMIGRAFTMHHNGRPVAKIIKEIERLANACITPADRHSAELFLKDLGL